MEIIIILAVLLVALWWFFLRTPDTTSTTRVEEAPKNDTPAVQPETTTAQSTAAPAWHTAPAEGTPLADNVLDVNKDGKVNLEDVKEAVKKTRTRVKKAADVDGNGKVTKADAKAAVKKVKEKATKTVAKTRGRAKKV